MEQIKALLDLIKDGPLRWAAAGVAFVIILGVLLGIKARLFSLLKKHAARTENTWDDAIVNGFQLPAVLTVIFLSLVTVLHLFAGELGKTAPFVTLSKILVIFIGLFFLDRGTRIFLQFGRTFRPLASNSRTLIRVIARVIYFSIAGLMILDMVGVSITPILASLGIGSLAVALALQDTLGNLFSGFYLLLDRPFSVGDYVVLDGGVEGNVEKIGWRSTQLRTLPNNIIILPNSKIASGVVTNYFYPNAELAVLVDVGVSYDSDLAKVEEVTIEVARHILKTVEGGVASFDPFIRYKEFGDSSINFTAVLRARTYPDNFILRHEFVKALHARYNKEGIEIPFPQRVIHFSGSAPALPKA